MTDNFPQYDPSVSSPSDPWSGEEVTVKTAPPPIGPVLKLGDETFKSTRYINKWALMALAAAERHQDDDAMAVAVYDMALTAIHSDDRARFNRYMLEHGGDDDTLVKMQEGVSELVAYWTGRKPEPPPVSSPASPIEETPPLYRHVSLSQGKVTVLPAPSTQASSIDGPESLVG